MEKSRQYVPILCFSTHRRLNVPSSSLHSERVCGILPLSGRTMRTIVVLGKSANTGQMTSMTVSAQSVNEARSRHPMMRAPMTTEVPQRKSRSGTGRPRARANPILKRTSRGGSEKTRKLWTNRMPPVVKATHAQKAKREKRRGPQDHQIVTPRQTQIRTIAVDGLPKSHPSDLLRLSTILGLTVWIPGEDLFIEPSKRRLLRSDGPKHRAPSALRSNSARKRVPSTRRIACIMKSGWLQNR